ncbi:MAG: AAA-like domain-containing protein [Cyanobacteria bacterium P01_A01_bin.83]
MVNFPEYNSPEWNAAWSNFLLQKALEKKLTKAQTRVFLTKFKQENWSKKIIDSWSQSDVNSPEVFTSHLTKVYRSFRDECPNLGQGAGNFPILRDFLRDEFSFSAETPIRDSLVNLPLNIPPYVSHPGALIRVKAPSKMGKTRLLNSILDFANEQEYLTIHINFLQIEADKFESLDLFLRWFCIAISDALEVEINLDQYWGRNRGSKQSCTMFLKQILQNFDQPLVIGLDDVDHLLKYSNISQSFFYLLRVWHEKANYKELWQKLRLIVVYSTEDFGSLNINKSPFNVGEVIELKSFNRQQTEKLAQQYRLNLSPSEIEQLSTLLGGHPYLVDSMMSHLAKKPKISLATLLKQAPTDIGIYSSFLRQLLFHLRENEQLAQEFLKIIQSETPIRIDTLLAYQLYWMGLIQWSNLGSTVVSSCELYRLYFIERLSLEVSNR